MKESIPILQFSLVHFILDFRNIVQLSIVNNTIQRITNFCSSCRLKHFTTLLLSDNNINEIDDGALDMFINIETISLNNNPVDRLVKSCAI